MSTENPTTRIFVTIGTDHHQFDRIIDWVDEYLAAHSDLAAETLVQHGQTRPSSLARNESFIEYGQLMQHMREATAVVVHGGPASIFEARNQGRLPVCVPRDPHLKEIVDEHQQRFARHLAEAELLLLCEHKQAFFDALDRLLADPGSGSVHEDGARLRETMSNLEAIVQQLPTGTHPVQRLLAAGRRRLLAR